MKEYIPRTDGAREILNDPLHGFVQRKFDTKAQLKHKNDQMNK